MMFFTPFGNGDLLPFGIFSSSSRKRWYSSVFLKKKSCFLRRMELLSFCNVRKGDITLYVAFLFILWYEAKDVAP